jgi:hypothetical protein
MHMECIFKNDQLLLNHPAFVVGILKEVGAYRLHELASHGKGVRQISGSATL